MSDSIRKHVSQMNVYEKTLLKELVKGQFDVTQYSENRLAQRRITKEVVDEVIANSNIVEYHLAKGKFSRVLIRGNKVVNNRVTCVVLDVVRRTVVTAYTNWVNNNHENSTFDLYTKDLNILESIDKSLNYIKYITNKQYESANLERVVV